MTVQDVISKMPDYEQVDIRLARREAPCMFEGYSQEVTSDILPMEVKMIMTYNIDSYSVLVLIVD